MNAICSLTMDLLRGYRRKREMAAEIHDLLEHDGGRVFSDIHVAPAELRDLCQRALAADDLLTPALRSMGINSALFAEQVPATRRDMQRICMTCRHRLRCHYHVKTATFRQNQRAFCGNSDNFSAILGQKPERDRQPAQT